MSAALDSPGGERYPNSGARHPGRMSGRSVADPVGEPRRALLQERGDALDRVGATARGRTSRASRRGGPASGARRRASATASAAPAPPTPARCSRRSPRPAPARRRQQLVARRGRCARAGLERLLGAEHAPGGDPLHRPADPDHARQEPARARLGHDPAAREHEPDPRASSAARRMSIGSVIVAPTPTAGPLIAAITGLVESNMRSVNWPPLSRGNAVRARRARASRTWHRRRQVGAGAEAAPGPVTMTPARRRRRRPGRRRPSARGPSSASRR